MSLIRKTYRHLPSLIAVIAVVGFGIAAAGTASAADTSPRLLEHTGVKVHRGIDVAKGFEPAGVEDVQPEAEAILAEEPEVAPEPRQAEQTEGRPRRNRPNGIRTHRAGGSNPANIRTHRAGGSNQANIRTHRAGVSRSANVPVNRAGGSNNRNIRTHRAGGSNQGNIRTHRAGG